MISKIINLLKGLGRQYSSYTVYGEALPEFKEQTHFDFYKFIQFWF